MFILRTNKTPRLTIILSILLTITFFAPAHVFAFELLSSTGEVITAEKVVETDEGLEILFKIPVKAYNGHELLDVEGRTITSFNVQVVPVRITLSRINDATGRGIVGLRSTIFNAGNQSVNITANSRVYTSDGHPLARLDQRENSIMPGASRTSVTHWANAHGIAHTVRLSGSGEIANGGPSFSLGINHDWRYADLPISRSLIDMYDEYSNEFIN